MSLQALNWAESQLVGSASGKALLLVLAKYANPSGSCWPSQETLAAATELSLDTVQRQTACLEKNGLIRRARRKPGDRFSSYVYFLLMEACDRAARCGTETHARTASTTLPEPQQAPAASRTARPKLEKEVSNETSEPCRKQTGPLNECQAALRRDVGLWVSWFSDLEFVAIDDDEIAVSASTRFRREYLASQLEHVLLRIFKTRYPTIRRIKIVVRKNNAN
jgi:DNA-binding transcriptional MocR family regulator